MKRNVERKMKTVAIHSCWVSLECHPLIVRRRSLHFCSIVITFFCSRSASPLLHAWECFIVFDTQVFIILSIYRVFLLLPFVFSLSVLVLLFCVLCCAERFSLWILFLFFIFFDLFRSRFITPVYQTLAFGSPAPLPPTRGREQESETKK